MRVTLLHLSNQNQIFALSEKTQVSPNINIRGRTYLDEEEVDPEGWEAPRQLDVLVLGVDLGRPHQGLVVAKDFLLNIFHFHEPKRKKLFQAGDNNTISGFFFS